MKEVTYDDYFEFIKEHSYVTIEDTKLEIGKDWKIKKFQPDNFELEPTNVWSFPKRGDWATHYLNSKYRGNWAPQVARNLILRYSKEGETVLDPFVGSGTTLIEAKLLFRNAIGVDINRDAVMLTLDRLRFNYNPLDINEKPKTWIKVFVGDARNLDKIEDESIDLIATHPPYVNIVKYTKKSEVDGDLSKVRSVEDFVNEMRKVAREFFRVLKPGRYCAILIGDTRRNKHHVPVSFRVMQAFLEEGFILKEDIIKIQHNMRVTPLWKKRSQELNFLLLKYEHLFVFRKPESDEKLSKFKESIKWW
ncbi:DNA methylase N-4/N-6 domain protein [Methanocaldococcus infernus ME]|uniref:Type II methyltransferase n=1 Tax=Methanocaldococcus infernus (strain DSM 11812 / JCM 15783 / ME) TaxID=573063 RepID=D5VR90_METIM|nr:DNA methyltransferase [Methanocaldococcus infernus]ADG13093.1 DNA methylase N-4/N-6 domain protein [Methanocaldococcus infernus ME]